MQTINIHQRNVGGGDVVNNRQDSWAFRFNSVLHNASQDAAYDGMCRGIVADALGGKHGCIMAYGQTGSGKTFTQMGDPLNFRNRGIAPRAIAQIFSHVAAKPETEFAIAVSYMEIYNERIYDLLDTYSTGVPGAPGTRAIVKAGLPAAGARGTLGAAGAAALGSVAPDYALIEDPVQGIIVRGLSEVTVESEEEALNALFAGELKRTTADHALNRNSNRSHCIFTLHVRQRSRLGGGKERIVYSKLHLVDLAGSERIKKTMAAAGAVGAWPRSRELCVVLPPPQ
jgi:kinesin family protein 6/9